MNGRWVKSHKIVKFPFREFDPSNYLVPRNGSEDGITTVPTVNGGFENHQAMANGQAVLVKETVSDGELWDHTMGCSVYEDKIFTKTAQRCII